MKGLLRRLNEHLLIWVAVCFQAGGAAASFIPTVLSGWLAPMGMLPLLAGFALLAFFLDPRSRSVAALPFFLLIGLVHTHAALQPPTDPFHLAAIISEKTKVTVTGRMLALPEFDGERTRFELAAESLLIHDGSQSPEPRPVRSQVQLSVQGRIGAEFAPGRVIMAIATLDRIRNYQTPGAFDYRLQMAAKGLYCSGWVGSTGEMLVVREAAPSSWLHLRFLPERLRRQIAEFLSERFSADIAGLYQALLIGTLGEISPQLLDAFKENGCFHVLSVSGLHFSLLGLFSVALLTALFKRSQWLLLHSHVPTLALALTAPLLLFYTCIAGMQVPAVRSLLTALLVLVAVVLRRERSFAHLIAAAALLILAFSPLALFTASFQLSFAAVLGINLIYPRLPVFLAEQGDNCLKTVLRPVQSLLYVSLAATAGTLPILLFHFNRVSLIGPVMNLVIEPLLCLWALPIGLLAIPFIWIFPELATLAFTIGSAGIRLTVWIAGAMAGFPLASIWTITPTFFEIALYFAILFFVLRESKTVRQWTAIAVLSLMLLVSFTASLWYRPNTGMMTVSMLDVGQGASIFVQLPDGGTILIDGGGYASDRFNAGQAIIAPYLWRQRLWRIDDLIVTHPHKDHYNGLAFIFQRFRPRRVIINDNRGDEPEYGELLKIIRKAGTPLLVATAGDRLRQGNGYLLECIGMKGFLEDGPGWSTNDRSLVLRLRNGNRSVLFPADIGIQSERRLVQNQPGIGSDVLLAPHHGSITSTGPELLQAVSPSIILVSASRARRGIQPAPKHLETWRTKNIPVFVTADHGAVTVATDGNVLHIKTFLREELFLATPSPIFP